MATNWLTGRRGPALHRFTMTKEELLAELSREQ